MDKTETIQGKSGHEKFILYQALESYLDKRFMFWFIKNEKQFSSDSDT